MRRTFCRGTKINLFIFLKGRGGEIKHLYRNYAFLYSKLHLDNGGIFVCKTRHLQLAGGNRDAVSVGIIFKISASGNTFVYQLSLVDLASYHYFGFRFYVSTNFFSNASRWRRGWWWSWQRSWRWYA